LAREVIRLQGLRPGEDVAITFTGLRPGEKLHEALVASDEWLEADPAAGVIAVGSRARGLAEVRDIMDRLAMAARHGADALVRETLFAAVAAQPRLPAKKKSARPVNPASAGSAAAPRSPAPTRSASAARGRR
jgi:O-antigen biosynthesis protein WbqV